MKGEDSGRGSADRTPSRSVTDQRLIEADHVHPIATWRAFRGALLSAWRPA